MSTALKLASGTTIVGFPTDWDKLPFSTHSDAAIEADKLRLSNTMETAIRVRYIHDAFFVTKENKNPWRAGESGYESFKDWCESVDRTEEWGRYMRHAADHHPRVPNVAQARQLAGLKPDQADAVIAAAKEKGPVTAKTIQEARREKEQQYDTRSAAELRQAREKREEILHLSAALKANAKVDRHFKNLDAPEKVYRAIKTIDEYCREQLEWAQKAQGEQRKAA